LLIILGPFINYCKITVLSYSATRSRGCWRGSEKEIWQTTEESRKAEAAPARAPAKLRYVLMCSQYARTCHLSFPFDESRNYLALSLSLPFMWACVHTYASYKCLSLRACASARGRAIIDRFTQFKPETLTSSPKRPQTRRSC
jgi:hypothetical protein